MNNQVELRLEFVVKVILRGFGQYEHKGERVVV